MKTEERIYLIPNNTKSQVRSNIAKNSPEHLENLEFFIEKICRNRDVKNILIDKQNNICPWCGEDLLKKNTSNSVIVIHHMDYNRICLGPKSKTYFKKKIVDIPNCLCCKDIEECLNSLAVVHSKCNAQINDFQLKELSSGNFLNKKKKENNNFRSSLEALLNNPIADLKIKLSRNLEEQELVKEVCDLYNCSSAQEKSKITNIVKKYLKEKYPNKYQKIVSANLSGPITSFLHWGMFGLIQCKQIGSSQKLLCLPEDFSWEEYCFNENLEEYIHEKKDMLYVTFPCFKKLISQL